jgi:hypothetical protein
VTVYVVLRCRLQHSFYCALFFYLWGHLKTLMYAAPVDNEEALHHRTEDACLTIRKYPASLNGCGGPWWDVSRRALKLMEDILSTYCRWTLSAITHKLNVSGHKLIWIFLLVLVCRTRARSLSAPFSYTLHTCHFIFRAGNGFLELGRRSRLVEKRGRWALPTHIERILSQSRFTNLFLHASLLGRIVRIS